MPARYNVVREDTTLKREFQAARYRDVDCGSATPKARSVCDPFLNVANRFEVRYVDDDDAAAVDEKEMRGREGGSLAIRASPLGVQITK